MGNDALQWFLSMAVLTDDREKMSDLLWSMERVGWMTAR